MHILPFITFIGLSTLTAVEASYPITTIHGGVNNATGERPSRLDINTFASNGGPQWDLFVLCMADIQARPQTQIDSWYQIAGIHGLPLTTWDGVGPATSPPRYGYCPQGSILFPSWHRPYLALLEQNIWRCARDLSAKYPQSTRKSYTDAAVTIRFPFWDWMKQATLPTVCSQPSITVTSPTGKTTISNPLYQYTFHPHPGRSAFPRNDYPQAAPKTLRNPDSSGNTNTANTNRALSNNAGQIHDTGYQILTRVTSYSEFSNIAGTISSQGRWGSIEGPHGLIHNLVGGRSGHMTSLEVSGFDPIFWLHHCNVDRLFSIWQTLNPSSWSINQYDNQGTYSIRPSTETAGTVLGPFSRDANGLGWTSTATRDTRDFGYTYPEVKPWGMTAAQSRSNTASAIRALYDPNGALGRRRSKRNKPAALNARDTPPIEISSAITENGTYKNWHANLVVDKFALPNSFNVYFFLGKANPDPTQWAFDQNLVGMFSVLRPSSEPGKNLPVYGTIPLTRALVKKIDNGPLDNLEVEQAEPFLKANFNWRVADITGKEIDIAKVPSLKVFTLEQDVVPPQRNDDFGNFGEAVAHVSITEDKKGGVNSTSDPTLKSAGIAAVSPQ